MSEDDVLALLRSACKAAGSISKWAKANGIKPQQADSCLRGERPPEPKILAALGVERVVTYRKIETALDIIAASPRGPQLRTYG